jgi:hypothetical protein
MTPAHVVCARFQYGFDQPLSGTGGKLTIDSDRLFNGSPERYNWKSLGKKEVYVPANAYKIHGSNVKYADLLKPGRKPRLHALRAAPRLGAGGFAQGWLPPHVRQARAVPR